VFNVTINWTSHGFVARQVYMTNLRVQDGGAFISALESFLRTFAIRQFSQRRPSPGPHDDGCGDVVWTENGQQRSTWVALAYTCPAWDGAHQRMTISVQGIR
jgi:hypothetical protein